MACDKCELVVDDVIIHNQLLGYKYRSTYIVIDRLIISKFHKIVFEFRLRCEFFSMISKATS